MQIRFFTIPVVADERDLEELNHFLRSHKIIGHVFLVGRPRNTLSVAMKKVLRGLVANGGLSLSFVPTMI